MAVPLLLLVLMVTSGCSRRQERKLDIQDPDTVFHQVNTHNNPMFQNDVVMNDDPATTHHGPPHARSEKKDNQKLAHKALSTLLSNENLSKSHIQVASYYGKVLVVGEVQSVENIILCRDIIHEVPEVDDAVFFLQPIPNNSPSQQISDSKVTTTVRHTLQNLGVSFSHIVPITNRGTIYLVGPIDIKDKSRIHTTLSQIPHVSDVRFI